MCIYCYNDYGRPDTITDKIGPAVLAVEDLYAEHGAGGWLHIVTDDWNLEDNQLEWCGKTFDLTDVEKTCLNLLQQMTKIERATVLAIHDGFLKV